MKLYCVDMMVVDSFIIFILRINVVLFGLCGMFGLNVFNVLLVDFCVVKVYCLNCGENGCD